MKWLSGKKQIAEYTGDSEDTVTKYLDDGMRHIRIGNRIKTTTEWADEYLAQYEVKDDLEQIVNEVVEGLK